MDEKPAKYPSFQPSRERATYVAEKLFQLLDDIDTASDEFKTDIDGYMNRVKTLHQERFKYINTDGYVLLWVDPWTRQV